MRNGGKESIGILAVLASVVAMPAPSTAVGTCTATAKALRTACGFEVQDEWWVATAICLNESDEADREECTNEAAAARREHDDLCGEQFAWRKAACGVVGEGRYDPEFDQQDFDTDFRHLTHPNPFFPLSIGSRWVYKSADQVNVVEVLDRTKLIDDVRCVVIQDLVLSHGKLKEATDDWYASAKDGNVWYCGEEVKNYEVTNGDQPRLPELVSIDGSFKAGRDGDKPGIIFLASPQAGDAYVEEASLGNAEDVTEILSTTYAFGHDADLDHLVPEALARALCSGDCVVSKNYSLLEPGIVARKYSAPGIGVFLEVELEDGEVVRLTSCNVDPRCATLPQP